jgi:hypothetical protein
LPIPQLISNFQRKSLAGFRSTVLLGWVFGDAFKTIYFFAQAGNSWQFKATSAAASFLFGGNLANSDCSLQGMLSALNRPLDLCTMEVV